MFTPGSRKILVPISRLRDSHVSLLFFLSRAFFLDVNVLVPVHCGLTYNNDCTQTIKENSRLSGFTIIIHKNLLHVPTSTCTITMKHNQIMQLRMTCCPSNSYIGSLKLAELVKFERLQTYTRTDRHAYMYITFIFCRPLAHNKSTQIPKQEKAILCLT